MGVVKGEGSLVRQLSPLDRFKKANARRLRLEMTDAERYLWSHLWRIPVEHTHFRRQVPIGPYFADFACHKFRLVIELDGSQHAEESARRHDEKRTDFLRSAGYRVVRFWNHDVLKELESVLDTIFAIVQEQQILLAEASLIHPTPAQSADPPPEGEGEEN